MAKAPSCFVALDFETADYGRDSACSMALVRVEGARITAREHRLIRPPRRDFVFTYLHGIDWQDVASEPPFRKVWSNVRHLLDGANYIAAHNASFDQGVLHACCAQAKVAPPDHPFVCTMRLARGQWGIRPTKLPDVCRELGIRLKHHDALSDAEACARIVIQARREGHEPFLGPAVSGRPR